MDMLNETVSAL
ncbi:MAG: hypothetical protein EZS28_049906, partial [Streblomastix strix]